jgi:Holliday junction DNA helicase RuvB
MHHHDLSRTARIARHHDHGGGTPTGRVPAGHGQSLHDRYPNFMREVGQDPLSREMRAIHQAIWGDGATGPKVQLKPLSFDDRSGNKLRPSTFDTMIGQDRLKRLMARIVANSRTSGRPLDHIMLAGQSGTGKTTLAQVVAHECGRRVYQIKAPVDLATLDALRTTCEDGDVVIVDEIHQQVSGDRRGVTQAADPEDFYHVMEDRRLPTQSGMLPFPAVTFIGCTTDIGLLPEAFCNRFPLTLTLDPYTFADMTSLAHLNGQQLGVHLTPEAEAIFGLASRRNPRQVNTYVRNAMALGCDPVTDADAEAVVRDLNGCTLDGLTIDMQKMLKSLLRSKRTRRVDNTVIYQASVNTIATALGHSRDTKAVALFVEPYLIEEGYVCVTHGGRQLTDAGIERARQL